MLAFDQLPKDVRTMMTDMNFNVDANDVLTLHQRGYSTARIRQILIDVQTSKHRADAEDGHVMRQR